MKRNTIALIAMSVIASIVLVACSNGGDGGDAESGSGASKGEARTVEIQMLDSLAFDPAEIRVQVGETVRFVIANEGTVEHEFLIGDEAIQAEHEAEMNAGATSTATPMEGMEHEESADTPLVTVAPGDVEELTRTFEEGGTFLYACHVPGHYAGGMVGTIAVS